MIRFYLLKFTYQHKVQHEEGTDDDEWDEEYPVVNTSNGVVGL